MCYPQGQVCYGHSKLSYVLLQTISCYHPVPRYTKGRRAARGEGSNPRLIFFLPGASRARLEAYEAREQQWFAGTRGRAVGGR